MDEVWLQLALVMALVVVNGLLAGSEIALVSLREAQVARLERSGGAGAVGVAAHRPRRTAATDRSVRFTRRREDPPPSDDQAGA